MYILAKRSASAGFQSRVQATLKAQLASLMFVPWGGSLHFQPHVESALKACHIDVVSFNDIRDGDCQPVFASERKLNKPQSSTVHQAWRCLHAKHFAAAGLDFDPAAVSIGGADVSSEPFWTVLTDRERSIVDYIEMTTLMPLDSAEQVTFASLLDCL
jgi:hypothetical protein